MALADLNDTFPGYHLVEQIYAGSRTVVYRAVPIVKSDNGPCSVVIKLLRQDYPNFHDLLQFRNQYTVAKNLNISGIVRPYSLETCGNCYALVMEDFEGSISLRQWIDERSGEWQAGRVIEMLAIALQLAEILHHLHQNRIIHKDIKPANILIHPESRQIKLLDFSIASLLSKETPEIKNLNGLEGTLAYLAPEQTGRMNRGIDFRTDFYALGVTLFELLTGQLPFQSEDPMELVHCHLAKQPPSPHHIHSNIPTALSEIISKLMAKNTEDRYQSALGLQHDLRICWDQWQETGQIANFVLAAQDNCDRFLIPEKLYGREAEVQSLLEAFDRVAFPTEHGMASHPELLLVAGFSGIGKTAVVHEVHKPIVRQRGYFIKGKFDQFNRSIPFSGFVQALRDLIAQLLTEGDAQLAQWKAKILEALGDNGQVMIDVVPELEAIVGSQPAVPELPGSEAQNRFYRLLQQLIQVFATATHPLVIFLDDLQWADLASFSLIERLIQQQESGFLLLIGAYRDNEVNAAHPLMLTIDKLEKANLAVNKLSLSPLSQEHINHLIADTLNCSADAALPLTQQVYQKAKGNPFFTSQLLKSFHTDGLITFNQAAHQWQCDMTPIKSLGLSDDVVEFMTLQLQKLPTSCQELLKLAACIGNQFDLTTLATVAERSIAVVAAELWPALREEFVLPQNAVYKFFQEASEDCLLPSELSPLNIESCAYRFLHDRIQQAAYALIAEQDRQATHLQMGRLLLEKASVSEREERLFEIVNHLNQGCSLIRSSQEREELTQLNLRAGCKAKASTAYGAALDYLTTGIKLLPKAAWEQHYELTLILHTEVAEAAYLNTDFVQMERWSNLVLQHAQTVLDTIPVQQTRLMGTKAQGQLLDAIQIGLQVLQSLGITFPDQPTQADVEQAFSATLPLWQGQSPLNLLDLPAMTDRNCLAAMQILSWLVSCTYSANPNLMALVVFKQVELSIQYGNCPVSIYGYVDYGVILCGIIGDISSGYNFGQLGLQLFDRLQFTPFKCRAWYVVYTYIHHWKVPLQEALPKLQEAYQTGLATGDIEAAGLNAAAYCCYAYYAGKELTDLADEIDAYCQAVNQLKQTTSKYYLEIHQQTVLNLLGRNEIPSRLTGKAFNAEEMLPLLQAANHWTALFYLHFNQVILNYLFGAYSQAAQSSIWVEHYLQGGVGSFVVPLYPFYDSLIQLALYADASEQEHPQILERVTHNQNKLQAWSTFAACNHQHRWELVAAEQHRVLGQYAEAIDFYDKAIASAKINCFIQDEALANELAAKFYLDWGKDKVAASYMQEAYYCYTRWGAKAKTSDLENRYPNLLRPILQQANQPLNVLETLATITPPNLSIHTSTDLSCSSSTGINTALDFASILKASQSLAGTIQLGELLHQLTQVILQNSGGDRCVLIRPNQTGEWQIEAIATLERTELCSIILNENSPVPVKLIHYVKNTREVVLIDDLKTDLPVIDEYLMQKQAKSILCLPILNQGNLLGILYVHNQSTSRVFTGDRILILNFLCTQAAISLENARLYQQAQTYAHQLEKSQLQIIQSEKMASLGNLVAGVAHEINNPIGFLNGSINNAKDYMQDLFDHLDLYQQHYPRAATPIQENAEDIDLEFLQEDLPKLLESMQEATDRIKSISNSLRTFSRSDTEYKVSTNLHEGIDSTLLILKYRLKANEQRPAIEVIQEYDDLPLIECFPGQLNQVFMNIIANAIDVFDEMAHQSSFSKLEANSPTITIQTTLIDQLNCSSINDRQAIEIRIRDNGKGISEDIKTKIFDHLFTTKGVGKGTGLGLAIARQIIVEKHGGTINVNSTLGQGTEFVIQLPLYYLTH